MRGTRRHRWQALFLSVLIGGTVGIAHTPAASGWEWVAGPPRTEARPWGVVADDQPRRKNALRIFTEAEYCAGEKQPFIHHAAVTQSGGRVVVRVYVRWPEPLHVSGSVEPGEASPGCADIVRTLSRKISLDQPRDRLKLYDGYFSPAKRVALR